MPQEEYYVRAPDSETARGPYPLDKLVSLAEAGQIDRESLYYDDEKEAWTPVVENPDLTAALFPEKKKLGLRTRTEAGPDALDVADTARPQVTVEQMLAAARGDTEETRHLTEQRRWEDRSASAIPPLLALTMLLSAASLIYPSWKVVEPLVQGYEGASWTDILEQPLPLVGAVDLLFAFLMMLAATGSYRFLRIRVMLGLGFFGFMGYAAFAAGQASGLVLLASALLFSAGVFTATLTLRFAVMVASITAAILGVAGYAVFTIFPELL